MRTKIYTKGGDTGETSLWGGPRVSKAGLQLEAYGTIDELCSHLGLCISHIKLIEDKKNSLPLIQTLEPIQQELFAIGSHLACGDAQHLCRLPGLHEELILTLEKQIDVLEETLPELKNFILPGGVPAAAQLHVARAVARRAERYTIKQFKQDKILPIEFKEHILKFLNRLSDYLFVAARYTNFLCKEPEMKWFIQ